MNTTAQDMTDYAVDSLNDALIWLSYLNNLQFAIDAQRRQVVARVHRERLELLRAEVDMLLNRT